MRVIIVGRDNELFGPLADRLTADGFKVVLSENCSSALATMKKFSVQFLLADPALLSEQNLAREFLKQVPLIRIVGLAANPTIPGLIEAITEGLLDYFPRTPEYFGAVAELLASERLRLARWQQVLLTDSPAAGD